ncbi:MAG: hypothetical protein DRN12_03505 [Thermoplasmata archaeon]|nr:MAG: hypothetical protein DRN12_03505 [Thermoplasmata archaeon]
MGIPHTYETNFSFLPNPDFRKIIFHLSAFFAATYIHTHVAVKRNKKDNKCKEIFIIYNIIKFY